MCQDNQVVTNDRMSYVEQAKVGNFIAYRKEGSGKTKSAKVIRKSTTDRCYMVESKYGTRVIVSFDEVVWVRTGQHWPLHLIREWKGGETGNE